MEDGAGGAGGAHSGNSKRLVRSRSDQWIGGVCGGLGEFFGVDSNLVRVVMAAATMFGGAGVVLYALFWLIVPLEGESKSIGDQIIERINSTNADEPKKLRDDL